MGTSASNDSFTAPRFASSALLVIDTQVDFLDGGASPIAGTSDRLLEMTRLVEAYRSSGRPIIHVIRLYDGDDVDLVRRAAIQNGAPIVRPRSAGAQIAPGLLPEVELDSEALLAGERQQVGLNEVVMWKPRWSAFYHLLPHPARQPPARPRDRHCCRGWLQLPELSTGHDLRRERT